MRSFTYYFYQNFDADTHSENPHNPRLVLGQKTDQALASIADGTIRTKTEFLNQYSVSLFCGLIETGVLREDNNTLHFNSPIFLREDAAVLSEFASTFGKILADKLCDRLDDLYSIISNISNGFSKELNLYHLLCGMVFDGSFFDYLCYNQALAVSRVHPSGLDYLTVIYEQDESLNSISDQYLLSYNRLTDGKVALQSFGDANGNRLDFFRYFRLLEQNKLQAEFADAHAIMRSVGNPTKDDILRETSNFIENGQCAHWLIPLLECFGYAKSSRICVPVYGKEIVETVNRLEQIVEQQIRPMIIGILRDPNSAPNLTSHNHGVNKKEIANELYHLLFGSINEELVKRGIVSKPDYIPGQGRFFRCIEI